MSYSFCRKSSQVRRRHSRAKNKTYNQADSYTILKFLSYKFNKRKRRRKTPFNDKNIKYFPEFKFHTARRAVRREDSHSVKARYTFTAEASEIASYKKRGRKPRGTSTQPEPRRLSGEGLRIRPHNPYRSGAVRRYSARRGVCRARRPARHRRLHRCIRTPPRPPK